MKSGKAGEGGGTIRDLRIAHKGKKATPKRSGKNPLRSGLRIERVPDPNIVVLFGATGDLAHRKVVPALYHLWAGDLLPERFALVCFGRREASDESMRSELRASLEKHARVQPIDETRWSEFASRISYVKGAFDDPASYTALSRHLDAIDASSGTNGNRLFYLATPASSFPEIIRGLGAAGLDHETGESGWRRVVIEKPFGRDLESAVKLNREVGKVFRES